MLRGTGTVPVLLAQSGGFPAGMTARWTLDDTGAGYVDLIGGLTLTAGGTPPTTAAGIINDAASFGGAGRLETPDAAALRLTASFAIDCWVRPDVLGALIAHVHD